MIRNDPSLMKYILMDDNVNHMVVNLRYYMNKVHITSYVLKYLMSFGINNLMSSLITRLITNGEGTFINTL